jgi:hypothetical protein
MVGMVGRAQGVSKYGTLPDLDKKAETKPSEDHQKKEDVCVASLPLRTLSG